jgi:hypothetical protein
MARPETEVGGGSQRWRDHPRLIYPIMDGRGMGNVREILSERETRVKATTMVANKWERAEARSSRSRR